VTEVTFTHTQFKTPVTVYAELIFAVCYMPNFKSVALVGNGGAAVPVEGEIEEIKQKITAAKQEAAARSKSNGI
jgi:hypothetical protein